MHREGTPAHRAGTLARALKKEVEEWKMESHRADFFSLKS